MISLLLVLMFGLAQAAGASAAQQPSDTPGEIRGRITDEETGLPVPYAIVRLSAVEGNVRLRARTDDNGRYRFTGVPPGSYSGFVESGEFRATHLQAPLQRPRSIVLKPGEVQTNVDASLRRARAITVRVIDEDGEPLAGVHVWVTSADEGRIVSSDLRRGTDDRGRLRLYGIPDGNYIIRAEPAQTGSFETPGAPRRERLVKTWYPSAASANESQPVRLQREDLDDLEIRMRRGRTFTIAGTLLDASGNPAPAAMVMLSTFERNRSSSRGSRTEADGRFTITNVEPGDYAVEAFLGGREQPEQRRDSEVAFVPVHVDSSDLSGVIVSMAKAVQLAGRFIVDEAGAEFPRQPPGFAPLSVRARLVGHSLPGSAGTQAATAGDDRIFYLGRMFGRRTLEVLNVPRGWYVKSIRYEGKEIIDLPTAFKASTDPSRLEIALSSRGATISGRVVDDRGDPIPKARVIVLPADPARWSTWQVANAVVSATGAFIVGPQRRGEYLVIALDPSTRVPEPDERDRLTALADAAERVTLAENEARTIDLRVVRMQ